MSSSSSGSLSPRPRSRGTCRGGTSRRRRRGRTFLENHVGDLVSIDFFVVPTATFRLLYVFVVLAHERRRVVHFNVTEGPSARWTGQQIINAFPYEEAPRYLLRDRDGILRVATSSGACPRWASSRCSSLRAPRGSPRTWSD